MNKAGQDYAAQYTDALQRFLRAENEQALLDAYLLGRRASEFGLGLVDVVRLHHEALANTLDRQDDLDVRVANAGAFLGETLASFEMVLRGYEETNARLMETNASLERAKVEVERAMESRSQFAAMISHEIRTPMSAMIGFNELLLGTELGPKQRRLAETVQSSAEGLLALLNDFLDFSKLGAGKLDIEQEPFSLRPVVENSAAMFSQQASTKRLALTISIETDVPDDLIGDAHRLRQILTNLLTNAIKFTHAGEVALRVSLSERDPDAVLLLFEVQDTGIGISEEALRILFKPFEQAESSTSRRFGGTGLGLAICKHLVEGMGGAITVASTLGVGSTFRFTARFTRTASSNPSERRISSTTEAADAAAVKSHAIRVLVAEDSQTLRELVSIQLEALDYRAMFVNNGLAVLDAWGRQKHEVILMDCQMPEMDGYQATREIRRRETGREHAIIIALTANVSESERDKCLKAGMDDYLSKPVSQDALGKALEKWEALIASRSTEIAGAGEDVP